MQASMKYVPTLLVEKNEGTNEKEDPENKGKHTLRHQAATQASDLAVVVSDLTASSVMRINVSQLHTYLRSQRRRDDCSRAALSRLGVDEGKKKANSRNDSLQN